MYSRLISQNHTPGISLLTKIVKKMFHPSGVDCSPPFSWTFIGNPGDGKKSNSTAKTLLIYPIRKIRLNRFKSIAQIAIFKYATFICSLVIFVVSYFKFQALCTHVVLIWLINVCWMLPLAWQKHWMIESFPSKISISSLPPMLFRKPCFYYCLFSSFSHSLFYFKLYKISTDSTPIGNLWLCGLIKYNGFQISGNKSYETPYSIT